MLVESAAREAGRVRVDLGHDQRQALGADSSLRQTITIRSAF